MCLLIRNLLKDDFPAGNRDCLTCKGLQMSWEKKTKYLKSAVQPQKSHITSALSLWKWEVNFITNAAGIVIKNVQLCIQSYMVLICFPQCSRWYWENNKSLHPLSPALTIVLSEAFEEATSNRPPAWDLQVLHCADNRKSFSLKMFRVYWMSKMSGFREYPSEYRILLDNVKNCDV